VNPCLAAWSFKTDSVNHLKAYFNATNTSNDFYYKWYFGDGTTSDLRTPLHTYLQAGKYKVCLSVIKKDSTCANYVCDSIVIPANNSAPCLATWGFKTDSGNLLKSYFFANNTILDFY
jgi:PKD repeat protein